MLKAPHALRTDRGSHQRQPLAQRLHHLQLHAGAVTQRHRGDARGAIQLPQLGIADIRAHADRIAGQRPHIRRRIGPCNGEPCRRHACQDQRQHLIDEPQQPMPVRLVREAADEQDDRFGVRRSRRREVGEAVRQQRERDDIRLDVRHHRGLFVRRIQHHVHVTPDGSFQHLHVTRLARDAAIIQLLRLLAHPAEMQIGAVVEQADPPVPLQLGQERGSHLRAAQQHMIEIVAVFREPLAEGVGVAAIGDLHADILQRLGIARTEVQILRPELHHHARLQQGADDAQHRAGAGIAIRLGHIVIDHQDDVAFPCTVARAHDVFAVGQMLVRQHREPALLKGPLVAHLAGFHAAGERTAVGHSLVVHDPRARLVQYLEAAVTQPERKIAVLAIGRRVAFVEPAHGVEQDARHHQRGRGAVVHLAQIVVGGPVRTIEPAEIPARAIVPDDAARLLQPAVGIQQLGADRADVTAKSGTAAAADRASPPTPACRCSTAAGTRPWRRARRCCRSADSRG